MKSKINLLFPFDMGLDLDFFDGGVVSVAKTLQHRRLPNITFFGTAYENADVESRIYKFGTGLISISVPRGNTLQTCAQISSMSSQIEISGTGFTAYCRNLAEDVIDMAHGHISNHFHFFEYNFSFALSFFRVENWVKNYIR